MFSLKDLARKGLITENNAHFDGLVQGTQNLIANALGLCLSCANPLN